MWQGFILSKYLQNTSTIETALGRLDIKILVQCRMGSSRLPGKALLPLDGTTVVGFLFKNLLKFGFNPLNVMAVIPVLENDLSIKHHLELQGIPVYCGSELDVLDRYYTVAREHCSSGDTIVRLTGDNPFLPPKLVAMCLNEHFRSGKEFTSTRLIKDKVCIHSAVPKGCSVDIFSMSALEHVWRACEDPFDREHVIPGMYRFYEVNHIDKECLDNYDFRICEDRVVSIDTLSDYERAISLIDKGMFKDV